MTGTVVASSLTPANNKVGQTAIVRQFKVTDIPNAMDKMKWPVAASLMRHWFAGKPWPTDNGAMTQSVKDHLTLAEDPYVEDTIVTMGWLVQFERVGKIIEELKSVWNNDNAIAYMRKAMLPKFSSKAPGVYPLKFDGKARAVEAFAYCNSRPIKFGLIETTDELRAALANFNMRVFPEGKVVVSVDSVQIFVNRIGFYAEDAYDFNDSPDDTISQPLGYWNFDGIANPVYANVANVGMAQVQADMGANPFVSPEGSQKMYKELQESRYFYISNAHFVKYRSTFHKGGDFRVFSDVLYQPVAQVVINLWSKA